MARIGISLEAASWRGAFIACCRRSCGAGRLVVIRPSRDLGVSKYSWSVPKVARAVRWGNDTGEAFLKDHGDRYFG